jgi:uncharacterized membrane protein YdfJ with MMPL/SSD domain
MARWARTMIRFRWAVLAAWIVLVLTAGMASTGLSDLLTGWIPVFLFARSSFRAR